MLEVDPRAAEDGNKHGIGAAFGEVVNPFGYEVDVLWKDPPSEDEDAVGNSQSQALPEPIQRKFLAKCINQHEKFIAPNGEEYHLIKVDRRGSHWEVWPPANAKNAENADSVKVTYN